MYPFPYVSVASCIHLGCVQLTLFALLCALNSVCIWDPSFTQFLRLVFRFRYSIAVTDIISQFIFIDSISQYELLLPFLKVLADYPAVVESARSVMRTK